MIHGALPLGPRLVHTTPGERRECLWCPDEVQNIEYQTKIMEKSTRIYEAKRSNSPDTIEEVVTVHNVQIHETRNSCFGRTSIQVLKAPIRTNVERNLQQTEQDKIVHRKEIARTMRSGQAYINITYCSCDIIM